MLVSRGSETRANPVTHASADARTFARQATRVPTWVPGLDAGAWRVQMNTVDASRRLCASRPSLLLSCPRSCQVRLLVLSFVVEVRKMTRTDLYSTILFVGIYS